MQFYELNSSRMDYRELSADDLNLLTPLLRSEETMQTLGGALSYEQTLDWLVDTLRRYQAEGCGWLLALDKPTGGQIRLNGKNLGDLKEKEIAAFRRENLGFVFQDFNLLDTFSLKDNIFLPLVLEGKRYREMKQKADPIARDRKSVV